VPLEVLDVDDRIHAKLLRHPEAGGVRVSVVHPNNLKSAQPALLELAETIRALCTAGQ
jgi:hypothetical protein